MSDHYNAANKKRKQQAKHRKRSKIDADNRTSSIEQPKPKQTNEVGQENLNPNSTFDQGHDNIDRKRLAEMILREDNFIEILQKSVDNKKPSF